MNRALRRASWRERFHQRPAPGARSAADLRGRLPASVNLRIDQLVLNGFPRSSAGRIARELERELTTLLQTRPLPASWWSGASIGNIRTAPVRLRSFADARGTAEQLARALLTTDEGRGPEARP